MSKQPINANKRWTEEDIDYIMNHWQEQTVLSIARTLGRTPHAIVRCSERLKLGRTLSSDMYLSTKEASDMISVDPTTIANWISKNELKANLLTKYKRKVYKIDYLDYLEFLRNNKTRWVAKEEHLDMFQPEDESWLILKIKDDNKTPRKKQLWTTQEEARVVTLVKEGYTNNEIAKLIGRSLSSVRRKRNRLYAEHRLGE